MIVIDRGARSKHKRLHFGSWMRFAKDESGIYIIGDSNELEVDNGKIRIATNGEDGDDS